MGGWGSGGIQGSFRNSPRPQHFGCVLTPCPPSTRTPTRTPIPSSTFSFSDTGTAHPQRKKVMAVRTLGLLLLLFLSAHHASAAASSYTQAALDDEITDLPGRLLVCACVRACVSLEASHLRVGNCAAKEIGRWLLLQQLRQSNQRPQCPHPSMACNRHKRVRCCLMHLILSNASTHILTPPPQPQK